MVKNILVILLTICLSLKCVTCEVEEETTSIVEELNFVYKNEKWTCGNTECPEGTIGCKIVAHTFGLETLYYAENCLDKNSQLTLGDTTVKILKSKRDILISVDTFIGAKSNYSVAYELGVHESVVGTIAVDELDTMKEEFKKIKANRLSEK